MLYRNKVAIFAGVVASITLLLVYVTGPKSMTGPEIRVLYVAYSDYDAVKRSLPIQTPATAADESVQVLEISKDRIVVIDRDEWDLTSAKDASVLLECTSMFPTSWKYTGFGDPSISEKNVRIHGNFNDSSTFSYVSLLNLMPLTEKSSGEFSCFGISNDTVGNSATVQIFVPGERTFLIDYDTNIDTPGGDEIFVPCPVANNSARVSLYFKNQLINGDQPETLRKFDPKAGFHLTPKFTEKSDPWGSYYCKNDETNEKSGMVTIQPVKGLIVNTVPEGDTVILSPPKDNPKESHKFSCQAKEEITLKVLRFAMNPMVTYDYNAASRFPFAAYTEVSSKQLRNLSRIYCRTVRNNEDLHSWKVVFSSLSMRSELMDFHYDASREDFACCSPSNKRAKLVYIPCNSVSECRIQGSCLLPARKCNSEKVLWLPERSGCVRHKLVNDKIEGSGDNGIGSGLLQCSINGKSVERAFHASPSTSMNNGSLSILSDDISLASDTSSSLMVTSFSSPAPENLLQIMQAPLSSKNGIPRRRFSCRGSKFFLAMGFLWQTVQADNQMKYHSGKDTVKGAWIYSQLIVNFPNTGSRKLKRLHCVAPLWNSDGEWSKRTLEFT